MAWRKPEGRRVVREVRIVVPEGELRVLAISYSQVGRLQLVAWALNYPKMLPHQQQASVKIHVDAAWRSKDKVDVAITGDAGEAGRLLGLNLL